GCHGEGGTQADFARRAAEPTGDAGTRTVEPLEWMVARKDGPPVLGGPTGPAGSATFHGKVALPVDRPRHRVAGIAGTFAVPDGTVLRIASRTATTSGATSFVFDVRVGGSRRPLVVTLAQAPSKGARDGRAIAFVDVGAAA